MQTFNEQGQLEAPRPARKRIRLTSAMDCKREMAANYRLVAKGQLEVTEASKRTYILAELVKAIQVADHEKEIRALQAKLDSLGVPGGAAGELPLTRLLPRLVTKTGTTLP